MTVLESCFSEKALYLAWERMLASVGSDAKDFFGISIYDKNLDEKLHELSNELIAKEYQPKRGFKYFEPKPSGTQRTKTVLFVKDAIVFQAIGNYLGYRLFDELEKSKGSVFGSVLSDDVKKWIALIDEYPDDFYFFEFYVDLYNRFVQNINETVEKASEQYRLETDITGFFDSIPHSSLITELEQFGIEDEILELLYTCLNVWSGTREMETPGVGIPQGPATSFLLANVILDSMDNIAIRSGQNYYRFMDDIRVYSENKIELQNFLVEIDAHLKGKSLSLNTKKTDIQKVEQNKKDEFKLISIYGLEVELSEEQIIQTDIEIQDTTQIKERAKKLGKGNKNKLRIAALRQLLKSNEVELLEFFDKYEANDFNLISKERVREFINLSYEWRRISSELKLLDLWEPNLNLLSVWVKAIDLYFWKADVIAWNLSFYSNIDPIKTEILELLEKYQRFEWVRYQIILVIEKYIQQDKALLREIIKRAGDENSPLVRLGYFNILLSTLNTDSKFFQSISLLIHDEKNEYVKKSILDTIHKKHFQISIDTLTNWFKK